MLRANIADLMMRTKKSSPTDPAFDPEHAEVITVCWMPEVEAIPSVGWRITFSTGTLFDYTIPFRGYLKKMAELTGDSAARVNLPEYEEHEDFIEGTLEYDDHVVQVYYEYSLGLLSLTFDDKRVQNALLEKLLPSIVVDSPWDR